MAASEKVYVCGRCEDFGAPTLEELVVHMTKCTKALQKPSTAEDANHSEENSSDVVMQEENENSDDNDNDIEEIRENETSPEKSEKGVTSSPQISVKNISKEGIRATSPTPFIWNRQTALLLLELVKDHKKDMESPYIKRKTVWHRIASAMQQKHGYFVNASQCENKFKNMTNRYKRTKELNEHKEGKQKQYCLLYHELDEYYKNDAKFKEKFEQKNETAYDQAVDGRYEPQLEIRYEQRPEHRYETRMSSSEPRLVHKDLPRLLPKELPRIAPKIIRTARYIEPNYQFISTEPIITLPAVTTPQKTTISSSPSLNDTEPVWVKKVVTSIEKWHKESIEVQREFIDVLKQLLEKKSNVDED